MRRDKEITRAFYRHSETGEIVVLEKREDGVIVGSRSASEPLRDLSSYEVSEKDNVWLAEQSNKLMLMGPEV
ncbi:MAG: hypothetical protein ACYTEK_06495 [Planctomycetota bacterium]|jgi:hypothetical protein